MPNEEDKKELVEFIQIDQDQDDSSSTIVVERRYKIHEKKHFDPNRPIPLPVPFKSGTKDWTASKSTVFQGGRLKGEQDCARRY